LNSFSLSLTEEALIRPNWPSLITVGQFRSKYYIKKWISLSENFKWKKTFSTQLLLVSEKLNNSLTWGIKISAVCSVVSSQSTRVSDRQTNRQSDWQSCRQYYDPQDLPRIAASRGKIYGMIRPFYLTVADRRLLRNYRINASRENWTSAAQINDAISLAKTFCLFQYP